MKTMEFENPYSDLKILAHLDRLNDLKQHGTTMPLMLSIYPTNVCNDKCVYCFFRGGKDLGGAKYHIYDYSKRKEHIPKSRLIGLAQEVADSGIKAVNISGGGEPTIADGFDEFCSILIDNNIDVGLTTNGFNLYKYVSIAKRFKYIRVSLDTYNLETRRKIRGSGKDLDNIVNAFTEIAKVSDCLVGLNFVITPHNYLEMVDFVKESENRGIQHINFVVPRTRENYNQIYPYRDKVVTYANEAMKLAHKNFEIKFSGFYEDSEIAEKLFNFCWYNWITLTILADGGCYPCCITGTIGNKSFGNINDDSLYNILYGEERKKFINEFDHNSFCGICWYNEKNRLIEYYMSDKKKHCNFV